MHDLTLLDVVIAVWCGCFIGCLVSSILQAYQVY